MRRFLFCACLLTCAFLAACGSTHHNNANARNNAMLFSPNGEPLNGGPLGHPTCRQAMSGWFDRVDSAHSGSIGLDAFLADAKAQFARMDIDHNGYLLAEEIDRFRLPYQQQGPADSYASSGDTSSGQAAGPHGGRRRGRGNDSSDGDTAITDQPDPVMSADTNNDFRVTPDEFITHARKVFAQLDIHHEGALSRDDVLAACDEKQR